MEKPIKIESLPNFIKECNADDRTIGLITGCFDIVHIGHIDFIKFAKSKVDILIAGIDSDENVQILKGKSRPIHTIDERISFLSEIESIDKIFINDGPISKDATISDKYFTSLYGEIMPNYVLTAVEYDSYWSNKKKIAESLGLQFVPYKSTNRRISTTTILKQLEQEIL